MSDTGKTVLVTGATGQQGGAVVRQLLANNWQVRALTRDPAQPAAQSLARQGVEVVKGDISDPAALQAALQGIYGVFSVQNFMTQGVEGEVHLGQTLAEAAQAAGVQHLVYSSVGGAERHSGIPHFESKWQIEQYIRALKIPATILRPVFFMENFTRLPDFAESIKNGRLVWALKPTTRLQLIALQDIGAFAALAFEQPQMMIGRELEIAGDQLTMPEVAAAFSRKQGHPVEFVEQPLEQVRSFSLEMALMLDWFNQSGYQAEIGTLKTLRPQLLSFEAWLRI